MLERLGLNAPMPAANSSVKKRAKGIFRLALCAAFILGLCGFIALQWIAPPGKTIPMWIFGFVCLLLICCVFDTALGARKDFEEARFLAAQARFAAPAASAQAPAQEAPSAPDNERSL